METHRGTRGRLRIAALVGILLLAGCDDGDKAASAPSTGASANGTVASDAGGSKRVAARKDGKYCGDADCPCKAGSEQKRPGGEALWICEMEKAIEIQGIGCGPGRTVFGEGGELTECRLDKDTELEGYMCKGKPLSAQFFAKSGHLKQCSLAKDAEVDGIKCKAGPNLTLTGEGKLWSCGLLESTKIGEYACSATLDVYADGSLRRCKLTEPATIDGAEIPKGSYLGLHEGGKLRVLYPSAKVTIGGNELEASKQHCFDDNGKYLPKKGCGMVKPPPGE